MKGQGGRTVVDLVAALTGFFFLAAFLLLGLFLGAKILAVYRERQEGALLRHLRSLALIPSRKAERSFLALAQLRLPLALRALQAAAEDDPSRAAYLFHRLGGWPRIQELARHPREGRRREAAFLLGLVPSSIPAPKGLFPSLLSDPSPAVRQAALLSLLARREEDGAEVAFAALWHYRDVALYRYTREALRLAGERAEVLLLRALSAKEPEIRWLAIEALGDRAHRGALPHLLAMASYSKDEEARIRATRSLRRYPSRETEAVLLALAWDGRWEIRAQAARSLGFMLEPSEAVLGTLAHLARDTAYWVRNNAVSALEALGPEGRKTLELLLDDPDPFTRQRVAEVFALAAGWRPA